MRHRAGLLVCVLVAMGCLQTQRPQATAGPELPRTGVVRKVMPIAETTPVESEGDAADDPAIWVNSRDPEKSLVIGTDKRRGLNVYDLDGHLLQTMSDGRMNNVDLRDGFFVDGRAMVLVAASDRSSQSIAFYLLDPETRRLTRAGDPVPTGFADPYGLCMYRSHDGAHFVFVSNAGDGRFRQWRVSADGGAVRASQVREFRVGSQAEGCEADDETGALYVAEEDRGLWKYRAGADGGNHRRAIDRVGGASGLTADLEGVSLWQGHDGRGYLVLSNQGANRYAVYRRDGDNSYIGSFEIIGDPARGIDGTSETDGLAATSHPLGPRFPDGLLVVQDGRNQQPQQHQNFKFVSWRDIAVALGIADGPAE